MVHVQLWTVSLSPAGSLLPTYLSLSLTHTHTHTRTHADKGTTERKLSIICVPLHVCGVGFTWEEHLWFSSGSFSCPPRFLFFPFFENKLVYIWIWAQRETEIQDVTKQLHHSKKRDFLSQCDDPGINIHAVIQHKRLRRKGKENP